MQPAKRGGGERAETERARPAGVKRAVLEGQLVAEYQRFAGCADRCYAGEGIVPAGERQRAAAAVARVDRGQSASAADDARDRHGVSIAIDDRGEGRIVGRDDRPRAAQRQAALCL